jgi:hypothetical protein
VYCKQLCDPHYRRMRRTGETGGVIGSRINGSLEQRFWPRIDKNGPVPEHRPELGPCWLWTLSTYNGYGIIRHGRRMHLAHRVSYELTHGSIPDELQIDHVCHNQSGCSGGPSCSHRRCVNPGHLEAVTNLENQQRAVGMHYAPLCRAGLHAMTDDNVRVTDTGIRVCRTCVPNSIKDVELVCSNGHPRTPENLYIYDRYYRNRKCRMCVRDATRRYRERKKQQTS